MFFSPDDITVNLLGIWRSFGLAAIWLLLWFWSLRPSFVLPDKLIKVTIRRALKVTLVVFVISLLLLPLDINFKTGERLVTTTTNYIAIVLDVSLSMSAKDVDPSRFIVAQRALDELIGTLEYATVWVIAFSGIPIVHIPFSQDLASVRALLETTTLADFPPTTDFLWTAMWDALYLALQKVDEAEAKHATIVLISDGDASQGADPLEVAAIALSRDIPIHTLAIGEEVAMLGVDTAWDKVIASLDSEMLQDISSISQWKFFHITDTATRESVLKQLITTFNNEQKSELVAHYFRLNNILLPLTILIALFLTFWKMRIARELLKERNYIDRK